jgi:hypothetical protein
MTRAGALIPAGRWPSLLRKSIGFALASLACSGGDATAPPKLPTVTRVELTLADSLLAIGDSIAATARANDSAGAIVSSLPTKWTSSDSGVMTVSDRGVLRGKSSGIAEVRATVGAVTAGRTVCVRGGVPRVQVVSGDNQRLVVRTTVSQPPVVRVADAGGNAIPCLVVRLKAGPTGATVAPDSAMTDAGGVVRVQQWTFSQRVGTQTLVVSVPGDSLTLHAEAVPGPPAQLKVLSGNDQIATAGQQMSAPLVVQVADQFGNALPNVVVAFRPSVLSSVITTPDATTDSAGIARTLVKVSGLGKAVVSASVTGVPPVAFSLRALGLRAKAIVSGHSRVCALDLQDAWYCWGDGVLTPTMLPGSAGITGVRIGVLSVCGIAPDTTVRCWGNNSYGQLGVLTFTEFSEEIGPVQPVGVSNVAAVFPGHGYSCALTRTGDPWCWGYGYFGEVGMGYRSMYRDLPMEWPWGIRFDTFATQTSTPCAIDTQGVAYCWGNNAYGHIGDSTTVDRYVPTRVATSLRFRSITNGSCALTAEGEAYCWGYNGSGELGDGTKTQRTTPVKVATSIRWRQLGSGYSFVCGLALDGRVLCWGINVANSFGSVTYASVTVPTEIAPGLTATALGVGDSFGCVISEIDEVLCWGTNYRGTLGDGTRVDRAKPGPAIPPPIP